MTSALRKTKEPNVHAGLLCRALLSIFATAGTIWASRPQADFHHLAAAGVTALPAVLLTMNAVAEPLRAWRRRSQV